MRPPRDTRTQLFVGNLPYRVRWQDLKDLFRRAGTVLRRRLARARQQEQRVRHRLARHRRRRRPRRRYVQWLCVADQDPRGQAG